MSQPKAPNPKATFPLIDSDETNVRRNGFVYFYVTVHQTWRYVTMIVTAIQIKITAKMISVIEHVNNLAKYDFSQHICLMQTIVMAWRFDPSRVFFERYNWQYNEHEQVILVGKHFATANCIFSYSLIRTIYTQCPDTDVLSHGTEAVQSSTSSPGFGQFGVDLKSNTRMSTGNNNNIHILYVAFLLKTSRVYSLKRRDQTGSFQSKHSLKGYIVTCWRFIVTSHCL